MRSGTSHRAFSTWSSRTGEAWPWSRGRSRRRRQRSMRDTCAERILAAVEALPADACRAFLAELGGRHAGSVLVERNQVCWAAASHLRRRLVDLLRESLIEMMSPAALEEMFQRCTSEGRRIGEELVSMSLVQGDVMR